MGDKIVKSKNLCCQPVVFPSLSLLSGIESLSGLHDLKRHDKITGLNDLNSLFGLKKSKAACTLVIGRFPCHQEPQLPQWPQQPQWPQWPQWPQQPHFIKTLTEHDVAINLATKWHFLVSQCGIQSSKIHNFMDFWHSFCWRLWRPWMLLSTKSKGHKSNVRISWMYRSCFYDLKMHFWWPN